MRSWRKFDEELEEIWLRGDWRKFDYEELPNL